MKIITQLVILILSLLLVNADQYCTTLFKQYHLFKTECSPTRVDVNSCCELTAFPSNKTPSAVYPITECTSLGLCGRNPFTTVNAHAYCDMTTDGGGWTVIQRNRKGSTVNFNMKWADFEEGFGDLENDFWYGLKAMHCLTKSGQWELRVDYQNNDKTWSYIHYNQFSVGNASEEYPLTVGGYTGVGSNALASHSGRKFTTVDNDNDAYNGNCASRYTSGWWFASCYVINFNRQPPQLGANRNPVLLTEMKIRPKNCRMQ